MTESDVDPLLEDLLGDLLERDPAALLAANPRWHPDDAAQKVAAVSVATPFMVERTIRGNSDWQLEPLAGRIRNRVRVLAADPERGASFTREQGERLTAVNPRLTFVTVTGAGHSIHRDDPQRVVAEALALLAG